MYIWKANVPENAHKRRSESKAVSDRDMPSDSVPAFIPAARESLSQRLEKLEKQISEWIGKKIICPDHTNTFEQPVKMKKLIL